MEPYPPYFVSRILLAMLGTFAGVGAFSLLPILVLAELRGEESKADIALFVLGLISAASLIAFFVLDSLATDQQRQRSQFPQPVNPADVPFPKAVPSNDQATTPTTGEDVNASRPE